MTAEKIPTLADFLAADRATVAAVVPATVCFAPGGTRRHAVLEGVPLDGEAYASWSREQMFACVERFFDLGVRHLIVNVLRSTQLAEVGPYRERLLGWVVEGLAGPSVIEEYRRRGWQARLLGADTIPELADAAALLRAETSANTRGTVWWYASAGTQQAWQSILATAARGAVADREMLIVTMYGEPIPPATMLVSYGKPLVAADIVPPLLADELQCYWYQRPGYSLTEGDLRQMFYDRAYTRATWRARKAERYSDVRARRQEWERAPTLGIGERLGQFWYPYSARYKERSI